jgi:CBS domain containing-hemolysin-like protein
LRKVGFFEKLLGRNLEDDGEGFQQSSLEAQDMIRGIVELSKTTVKEIMVPRIDVVFVSVDMDEKELLDKVSDCGHSRFPVYRETIDNVVGMLYVKDLLRAMVKNDTIDMEKIVRKAYFVPESKRLDSLLREFRRRRVHIAVVVDEYGGVSGIACLEDIIEEIVGDIQDEFDNEREDILEIGDGVYLCDARANIEDLNEELDAELPDEDFDTLGGFVFDLFGKIPVKYEKVSYRGLDFIVQNMDGHKIKTVKIVRQRSEELAE